MTEPEEDFDSFFISAEDVKQPDERTFREGAVRRGKRYLHRSKEAVLGLPGDIVETIRGVAQSVSGYVPAEEEGNFVQRAGRRLVERLPTSAELRARSAEKRPELEPESESETAEDEWVEDIAALSVPIPGLGRVPLIRALGIATASNLGKQIVKEIGLPETAQDLTKMGVMVFTGMFGKGRGVNSHINKLYREAEAFVPKGTTFTYPTKKLQNVESILKKGTMDDAKASVMKIVDDIKTKMPGGVMAVEEAVQFDKDINRAIRKSSNDKTKLGLLKKLKGAHAEALDTYAKENPTWGEHLKEAKQAYQGIATSENIKNFVKRNANIKNLSHAALLLGMEEAAIPGALGIKLGTLGTSVAVLYSGEMAKRLAKNPALRRYYGNVLSASLSENKTMLARNLSGLERVAKKEFENNPLPIFDIEEEEEEEF